MLETKRFDFQNFISGVTFGIGFLLSFYIADAKPFQPKHLISNNAVKSPVVNLESDVSTSLKIIFSHERNYYDKAFQVILTSNKQDAKILYTFDCSQPSENNGTIYTAPITVDSTTIIKAIAILGDSVSKVYTNTYLFSSTLKNQPQNPKGFPENWGGSTIISADYEMDPEII